MGTCAPFREETTGTVPGMSIKAGCVGIILTAESRFKLIELNTIRFLRILFRLGDLPDHAGLHGNTPLSAIPVFASMAAPRSLAPAVRTRQGTQ